jgi:hypothetical protein
MSPARYEALPVAYATLWLATESDGERIAPTMIEVIRGFMIPGCLRETVTFDHYLQNPAIRAASLHLGILLNWKHLLGRFVGPDEM